MKLVTPYIRHPSPPRVALLLDAETILDEQERQRPLDSVTSDERIFCSWELVGQLLHEGKGESLCWNGEPIRWRRDGGLDGFGWPKRSSDVYVLRVPWPDSALDSIEGLRNWRDWLASNLAAPVGSLGSAAWSLLRACLESNLWCSSGDCPPLSFTLGGRQELGRSGAGEFSPAVEHWDMPAAYASTLAGMKYGGWWRRIDREDLTPRFLRTLDRAWERGLLTFWRCRIRIPADLEFGPLPRRPRIAQSMLDSLLFPTEYPTGKTLQGIWTRDELEVAMQLGCKVQKVYSVWTHLAEEKPFMRWWLAVLDGRNMHGFAGALAKATGNSLWGQFAITPGVRSVEHWRRNSGRWQRRSRPLPLAGQRPAAVDLTESLTGLVRARMAWFLNACGDRVLSAHTDGGWVDATGGFGGVEGWRRKESATVLRLLGPQTLSYVREGESEPLHVVAGVPARLAPEVFEEAWTARA